MKKCPVCELNWVQDNEEMCSVCAEERNRRSGGGGGIGTDIWDDALKIHIKYELATVRGVTGYKVYDEDGHYIGIVFKSNVPGEARHECAELCFLPGLEVQYGLWRVIRIDGVRIKFDILARNLENKGELIYITDARSRARR